MLARPLRWQFAESGDAHAVRETSFDRRLDEVGREEGKRDRHVDFARTAALACCNGFDSGIRNSSEFVKPAASSRNRRDQKCAILGTDRPNVVSCLF